MSDTPLPHSIDDTDEIIRCLGGTHVALVSTEPSNRSVYLPVLSIGVIMHAALSMRARYSRLGDAYESLQKRTPQVDWDTLETKIGYLLPDLERMGCSSKEAKCEFAPTKTGRDWGGLCAVHTAISLLTLVRDAIRDRKP